MRFGTPFSAGLGTPANMVAYGLVEPAADRSSLLFRFMPASGWGNAFFAVFRNAVPIGMRWCPEGVEQSVRVPVGWGSESTSLLALRVGRNGDPNWDGARVARTYEADDSKRVTLAPPFTPEILGAVKGEDDGVHCSNWSLAGLDYRRNVVPLKPTHTRAYLELALAVAGGNVTVTLAKCGVAVASGTGTVGGTITLAEANGSGLSGSVDVAAGVVSTTGARLYLRWPARVEVLRDTTTPPTTLRGHLIFTGDSSRRWTETADLVAGTHYYRIRAVTDTGELGTASSPLSFAVPNLPAPPANVRVELWTSPTYGEMPALTWDYVVGVAHRVYMQEVGAAFVDVDNPLAWVEFEHAAGREAALIWTVPPAGAGTRRFVVRSVAGGIEERNLNTVEVESEADSNWIPPRPNVCGLAMESEAYTAGLTLAVPALYDSAREKGVATHVHFYKRAVGGSYPGTPDAVANLSGSTGGVKRAALTFTFAAAGWYYVQARAATAADVESPAADCPEYLVYVSDADPAAPSIEGELSRG